MLTLFQIWSDITVILIWPWLVIGCFLPEQDVYVSTSYLPCLSLEYSHYFRKLVLVWILLDYSFLSLNFEQICHKGSISLFAFLWQSTEQLRYPVHACIFWILLSFRPERFLIHYKDTSYIARLFYEVPESDLNFSSLGSCYVKR